MSDEDITVPFVTIPRSDAFERRALVSFHGYIETAGREVSALACAFTVADLSTALAAVRALCVALLAAERIELLLDGMHSAHARRLLRRTLDVAVPWLVRAWNAAPGEVERIFRDLAESIRSKTATA